MNIQLKDMKLIFEVHVTDAKLRRYVTDMQGTIIWDSGIQDSNMIDNSEEGLSAWETQMKSLPFWKIVSVEKSYL
jgi:hypothetical protein